MLRLVGWLVGCDLVVTWLEKKGDWENEHHRAAKVEKAQPFSYACVCVCVQAIQRKRRREREREQWLIAEKKWERKARKSEASLSVFAFDGRDKGLEKKSKGKTTL